MKLRYPEAFQWYGLFGAAFVWAAQLLIGFAVAQANCNRGSVGWGIDLRTWQSVLMGVGLLLAASAEVAAISVVLATRDVEHDDPPPRGRRHFFAWGAMLGNLVLFNAILLQGIGAIVHGTCQQA
ncbi:MAG: hypothetical protein ACJ747_09720 [Gaiellaceae bacterium]